MTTLFPFPGRVSTLPTDMDSDRALRLLKAARYLIESKQSGYICNAILHAALAMDGPDVDEYLHASAQLETVIEARLGNENTYTGWLLDNHQELYWVDDEANNHDAVDERSRKLRASRLAWIADLIDEIKENEK